MGRGSEGPCVVSGAAVGRRPVAVVPVWASDAIDLITDVPPVADLAAVMAVDADDALLQVSPMAT